VSDQRRRKSPFRPKPSVKSVKSVFKATAAFRQMCRQPERLGRSLGTCPDPRSSRRQPIQTGPKSRQFIGVSGPRPRHRLSTTTQPQQTPCSAGSAFAPSATFAAKPTALENKPEGSSSAFFVASCLRVRLRQITDVFSHEDTKARRHEGFEILEPRIERADPNQQFDTASRLASSEALAAESTSLEPEPSTLRIPPP
jgi:hypothetical protein